VERLDAEVVRRRLAKARVGRLATVGNEGHPHVVPCSFAIAGRVVYTAVDDVKAKRTPELQRVRNVLGGGRAALLVDHYEDDWSRLWWVRADCRARVVDSPIERARALDLLAAKYTPYHDRRPTGAVLALDMERISAWDAAGGRFQGSSW
jgi:PPOX class probable F420-dependent enzyme